MYRKYYNEYEKKAEQIRKGTVDVKPPEPVSVPAIDVKTETENKSVQNIFGGLLEKFAVDDIILLVVIIMLLQEENKDKMLLIILGYLFISGI